MTPTRDSLIWFVALGASVVAYLMASEHPPSEWDYREWLKAAAAAFAALSTKLQASPLPLSYSGQAKLARGEWSADVPPPKAAVHRRKARERKAEAAKSVPPPASED